MNTAIQSTQAVSKKALGILDELGYGDMTVPVERFNDDDWYLFSSVTFEIKAQFGPSQKHVALSHAKAGLSVERGMRAKHMGLWRLPSRRAA